MKLEHTDENPDSRWNISSLEINLYTLFSYQRLLIRENET